MCCAVVPPYFVEGRLCLRERAFNLHPSDKKSTAGE